MATVQRPFDIITIIIIIIKVNIPTYKKLKLSHYTPLRRLEGGEV
jgi:hypothetical protein